MNITDQQMRTALIAGIELPRGVQLRITIVVRDAGGQVMGLLRSEEARPPSDLMAATADAPW